MTRSKRPLSEKTPSRDAGISQCACVSDAYANLPGEMRPKRQPKKGGLRQATCPGCGFIYWTNRKTELCIECEKSDGEG